jgi:hypothetical protein
MPSDFFSTMWTYESGFSCWDGRFNRVALCIGLGTGAVKVKGLIVLQVRHQPLMIFIPFASSISLVQMANALIASCPMHR